MLPYQQIDSEDSDQTLLLAALQTANEATAIYTTRELRIRFANDAMLKIWGKGASPIGMNLDDALPELAGQPFIDLLQRVWDTGVTSAGFDTPAQLVVDDKLQTFYFDFEYRAIQNEFQKTVCIIHAARDVTQRRQHMLRLEEKEEEAQVLNEEMAATLEELLSTNEELNQSLAMLADSREHVRTIIEQAPIGICMLQGRELRIELANAEILRIWGRSEAEVVGKSHQSARPELHDQPMNDWLRAVYDTGIARTNTELRVLLHDKTGRREAFVNSIYKPIRSSKGNITGVLIILEEVTEQLARHREYQKSAHMFAMAVEAAGLGTFFYEPDTGLFSGNDTLKSWFGLSSGESMELSKAIESIYPEDRPLVAQAISDALDPNSKGDYFVEYRIKASEHEEIRMVEAIGRTIFDGHGTAVSLNGTLRDITEQKKDQQRKDDFISMVSHELKTPLTSINGYMQLMQRRAISSEDAPMQNLLEKAVKQIANMKSMIHGFLDVSRLESGKLVLNVSRFDIAALLATLDEEYRATVETHRIEVKRTESIIVNADMQKIAQVVQNLVSNAVKYAPSQTIISLNYRRDGEWLKVSVQDEGPGIALEDRENIFDRYYRAKNNESGIIAGFGIGLYLCREIIERHGGHIYLEESQGGAKFTFALPLS
ncbi:ATP-binding protein [Pedobacter namyangjuensis]|uniref:ATP-binding protein n=1 Tax=Pedobacter namyangjuensis TaxID=600626 RepID=UPI0013B44BA2|nr:ATP-binding protein [Pedobacter namyangjuensis]